MLDKQLVHKLANSHICKTSSKLGEKSTTRTHTHPFNGPFSRTTQVSRYQKGKANLDSTEARDSEWQWHQLGHMQVYTSLQTDNHASTQPFSFLQARCPSCHPTNSVKALKAQARYIKAIIYNKQLNIMRQWVNADKQIFLFQYLCRLERHRTIIE